MWSARYIPKIFSKPGKGLPPAGSGLKYQKLTRFFKTVVCLVSALSIQGCAINHYDYAGRPASTTPFDLRYRKVQEYLKNAHDIPYKEDSFEYSVTKRKSQTFGKSHGVPFDNWKIPPQTEIAGGDCEDKAIWLYCKLVEDGFEGVRLFVGKHRSGDDFLHAWVIWYTESGNFILDPTNDDRAWPTKSYPTGFYEPYYSYFKDRKWSHLPVENNGSIYVPTAAQ